MVLNLIWVLTLYVPLDSSFLSTQFFVLNLDSWFGVLSNKFIIFDIQLLYYYTNLNSSIISYLFYGDIYLSFGISVLSSFVFKCNSFKCNSFGDFETLITWSAILLPIKSPVSSAVFWIILFEAVFIASVVDFLALPKIFRYIYCLHF